jgi:rhodanese-related sulfurtransferase
MESAGFQAITALEAVDLIAQGACLVDVREEHEYAFCKIEGSVLCPLSQFPESFNQLNLSHNKRIIFYCHHGVRSAKAAMYVSEQGFTDLYSLTGGIEAWSLEVDSAVPRY